MENVSKVVPSGKTSQKLLPIILLFLASAFVYPYPSWISICETKMELAPPLLGAWFLLVFLVTGLLFESSVTFVLLAGPPLAISALTLVCIRSLLRWQRMANWLSVNKLRRWSVFLLIWALSISAVLLYHIFEVRHGIFDIEGFCTRLPPPSKK